MRSGAKSDLALPFMPPKHKVGTIVLSSDVDVVGQFNKLNALIVHGLPETARAYDTLQRHLPLLREMQALLSQRPGNADFTMLYRLPRGTLRFAKPAEGPDELPTWTQWITAYANAIDYSGE